MGIAIGFGYGQSGLRTGAPRRLALRRDLRLRF